MNLTMAGIISKLRKIADDLEREFPDPDKWDIDQEEVVLVGSELRVTGRALQEAWFGMRA